jgi:hypothetical protein
VGRATGRSELGLERLEFRAEDEPAAIDHTVHRGAERVGILARLQRQERHAHVGSVHHR